MRLSKRGEYCLRAMITLAEPAKQGPSPVMSDVRNAIADILDNTSLADVIKRQGMLRKKFRLKQNPGKA